MSFSRILGDGRINLEQQRKRAKELLRQWSRDPASRTGLPGQAPRLADAQWQVARLPLSRPAAPSMPAGSAR